MAGVGNTQEKPGTSCNARNSESVQKQTKKQDQVFQKDTRTNMKELSAAKLGPNYTTTTRSSVTQCVK